MKILRIFGIVAAVHFFAFVFIMANPGCSTKSKNANTTPGDSMAAAAPLPASSPEAGSPFSPMPAAQAGSESGGLSFDPNAIAGGSRFTPTRPNTPAAGALQEAPATDVVPATTVTVGKGDSLWSLAKKTGVPVTELAAANNLKTSSVLQVGQKLVVPGKVPTTPSPKATPASKALATGPATHSAKVSEPAETKAATRNGNIVHVVKPGEMLGVIARKYGVSATAIAVANNLTNPAIIPVGKELIIPVKGKAGAASTESTKGQPAATAAAQPERTPAVERATAPASNTSAQPAAPRNQRPVMPIIGSPSESQDLDAGLAPASNTNVPVIKIEEEGAPRM
jgi:LysM repeat protein